MRKLIFVCTLFTFALALTVHAVDPREMSFPPLKFQPPEPVRFVTDNGMVVFFLEDHQLPILTAVAFLHGGSSYDPPGKAGLAEITAQLLRSGGAGQRSPEQVDEDLDFVATRISSGASRDELTLSLNAMRKDAELAFEILSDMVISPGFDTGKVSLELSNKAEEIRRQNDEPARVTRRIYYQTVYTGHPYGVYPTLASIGNISREDILSQHRKYYAPDNCILAVSGDMTLDEIKALVNKYLGRWQKSGMQIQTPAMATMQYMPGVYYVDRDVNQANIRLGHLSMDIKNPDRHAMDVMNFILGGGFVSRMASQVRTTAGLAYSVGSYSYNRPLMGTFFAYCMTRADAMARATRMIMDIISEVKENGITAEEMDLGKESIINSFVFNYDTPGKIATAQAYLEFYQFPPDQLEKDVEALQAVTLEDCKRVAQKYLSPDKLAIVIVGNKEMFDQPPDTFGPVMEVSLEKE
ncbi:MAG: insulinase family protein [Candidatus Zixiibacteriota bacterium]|nr:MAG: insulinase family protein [candidate division Zixibacteria bacterium]